MEARARHTVDVFQTPMVDSDTDKIEGQQTRTSVDSQPSEMNGDTSECQAQEEESVSMVDSCGGRPTKRIRVVFGEPHQQPRSKPLFQLAVTNEEGEYVLFSGKEKRFNQVDDDQLLKLDTGTCIAVDWINKKGRNTDHLVVLTKDDLDCDEEPTAAGGRSFGGTYSGPVFCAQSS